MSEMLIQRIINRENLFNTLKTPIEEKNVIYTDDEGFLTHMYDVRLFEHVSQLDEHIVNNWSYFKDNNDIELKIRYAFSTRKSVVNSIFQGKHFKSNLDEFLSKKENRELKTDCIWNVALFYNQINQIWYKPVINTFLGHFTQKLTELHENIDIFVENYLKGQKIESETEFSIKETHFTPEQLIDLDKSDSHSVSISGRLDLFNPEKRELFEIKASGLKTCSQEWIIQTLCYTRLLDINDIKVERMFIVNVLKGDFKKDVNLKK